MSAANPSDVPGMGEPMHAHRTDGMKVIGVMNVIIGAMSCLIGILMAIVGGGFMPAPDAKAAGIPGDFVMLCGIATAVINVLLLIAGVGVLRVASWGRSLSIAYAALGGIVYSAWLIGGDLDMFFGGALAYAGVLAWLFCRAPWRDAFRRVAEAA